MDIDTNDPNATDDKPAIRFPPPLVYLGFLLLGLAIDRVAPIAALDTGRVGTGVAIALVVIGLAIAISAIAGFRRAGENPEPWTPSETMVLAGPYRFTRNPMYLGIALAYLGLAIGLKSMGALLLLPIAIACIHYFVIRREEAYLIKRFGESYRGYCAKVRRWI